MLIMTNNSMGNLYDIGQQLLYVHQDKTLL